MLVKKTIKPGSRLSAESVARLRGIKDKDIDHSDIPASTDVELARAVTERGRGGARTGAGRKLTGHVNVTFSISPATKSRIRAKAKKQGINMSELIDRAFSR